MRQKKFSDYDALLLKVTKKTSFLKCVVKVVVITITLAFIIFALVLIMKTRMSF